MLYINITMGHNQTTWVYSQISSGSAEIDIRYLLCTVDWSTAGGHHTTTLIFWPTVLNPHQSVTVLYQQTHWCNDCILFSDQSGDIYYWSSIFAVRSVEYFRYCMTHTATEQLSSAPILSLGRGLETVPFAGCNKIKKLNKIGNVRVNREGRVNNKQHREI